MDPAEDWQAQYDFWHRIISEEVQYRRLLKGLESICIIFYPVAGKQRFFVGKTILCGRTYQAILRVSFDEDGRKILKFQLSPQP